MGQVSHEQAGMLLRLFELRREARMRQAREWFIRNFYPQSLSDRASLTQEEDANVRMVTSYWDMVAGFVKRALVEEEMFFENTAELWIVWDRLKPIVSDVRETVKDPHVWENMESVSDRYEKWRERRAPGSVDAARERMRQLRTTLAEQK